MVVDINIKRRQGNQGVGWSQSFNDHLRDFSVGWQIPPGTRIAVGVESAAVGAAGGEPAGFAQYAEASPIKQRGPHSVNHELWLFNGQTVLAAGTDFEGDVGQFGTGCKGQFPISARSLARFWNRSNSVQGDPPGVVTSLQWPCYAAWFSVC